ncbi:possible CDPK [Ectocarpus siliculosus]|uniref:Possible CDPK n=1 Tax=Ectocarpus siliculosus TaxID=2880 RepID=D8LP07_ECTSI|nr:possible CDPK [Ectocarpus siliculosus]|eukprot:CBN80278.1 possible CDPK [Ectocarpus siliculosus]
MGGFVSTQCGTPGYVAPEILRAESYGTSVDMWSIGVIVYILLGGYPPFHDENQTRLFRKIKAGNFKFHPEYWQSISNEAKDLIRRLLTVDPKKRLTAAQAVTHPWLLSKDADLLKHNLGVNLEQLRLFNARRKLRAAIKSVLATQMMAGKFGIEAL